MKASALKGWLTRMIEENGDLEVRFAAHADATEIEHEDAEILDSTDIEGIATILDEQDQPKFLMICDIYTLEAIS